jgi:tRNA G18 (ribose-2'-O)-methylase SpoU
MRKLRLDELGRLTPDEFKKSEKLPLIVILDNIRSAHNVGSIFRTSDAFAVEKLILCGITAQPPHREIHKTAIGATDSVRWEYVESAEVAVKAILKTGYELIVAEQTDESTMLDSLELPDNTKGVAIVFGNEVDGVSEDVLEYANRSVEIPQFGTKHSFNVAVSAGIVIWELSKKLRNA